MTSAKLEPKPGQDPSGDGPFDKRRSAEAHLRSLRRVEKLERRLRAQDGAPDIEQDEHTLLAHNRVDAFENLRRVGPKLRTVRTRSCGDGHGKIRTAHRSHEFPNRRRQRAAVGDKDKTDHDRPRARKLGRRLDRLGQRADEER